MTEALNTWRLDLGAPSHTLVFSSINNALPSVVYCGPKLPSDISLKSIALAAVRPLTPGTLDQLAPLSLLPEEGRGFQSYCGLQAADKSGRPALTQFQLTHVDASDTQLVFHATDTTVELTVSLHLVCDAQSGVLKVWSELHNTSNTSWRIDWLSVPVLPVDQSFTMMQNYSGRWTQEFTPVRSPIQRGVYLRESRRARGGHDHFPALIVGEAPLAWTHGNVAAMHYSYSDVHRMAIESLPDGRQQLQAGIAESRSLEPGDSLHSGEAFWAFSSSGINTLAHHFQHYVRSHIVKLPEPSSPRLVNYNCWEAIYFDHNVDRLKALASSAASVGAERFVLDDGWFCSAGLPRNDDTSSLGDWYVDENKYPNGLTPLIEHVNAEGMQFGIWFEPEMVNPNSALAKKHPEWVLAHGEVHHIQGRNQQLLDLTIPEVVEYLFERLDEMLSNHNIRYVKWDMNRDATRAVDTHGYRALVRQSNAVCDLMARLRKAHPQVELESCASGGGRIDYRVLKNTHRVWLSDSIDARVRWKMQSEAFVFVPPCVYGSHVGAEKVHTSARKQAMSFRALVAMTGHMGIESDIAELNQTDRTTLAKYIDLYKTHREWMHAGLQYRLDTVQPETLAQQFVAADQSQFLLFSATLDVPIDETTAPIRCQGLIADQDYRVTLVNQDDIDPLATRIFDSPFIQAEPAIMSGTQLMLQGIVPPFPMPDSMWLFYGEIHRR